MEQPPSPHTKKIIKNLQIYLTNSDKDRLGKYPLPTKKTLQYTILI